MRLIVIILFSYCTSIVLHAQEPTWKALPNAPMTSGKIDDLYFINPDTGWTAVRLANGTTQIHKTTDGGKNWSFTIVPTYTRSIRFTDANNGWLGSLTDTSPFWRTTDGGASWAEVENLPEGPKGICGLFSIDTSHVFGVGRYSPNVTPYFIKSTDGGANWTVKNMSSLAGSLVDIYFFSPDTGYVVGSSVEGADLSAKKARVLRTTNSGDTWTTVYDGTQAGHWCWKILFTSPTTGYASIEPYAGSSTYLPRYLKTTDSGLTWELKTFPEVNYYFAMQGIQFLSEGQHGWIGGHSRSTYETTDGGESWTPSFGTSVNRFRMFSDTLGYASGRTIYKYTTESITSIETYPNVPAVTNLDQNYPNPFNPSTTIEFKLNEMTHVRLTIVDALGREVATLINEELDQGIFRKHWDATGFPSGTYFYRLVTPQFTETRKMVLVK